MNEKKLLADKRRALCHELGHALYFLKYLDPLYYNKTIKYDNGFIVERISTLDVFFADEYFEGQFLNNGAFYRKENIPVEKEVGLFMSGLAMENAIYYNGFSNLVPYDKQPEVDPHSDIFVICEKLGTTSVSTLNKLYKEVTSLLIPYSNRVYKQARLLTSDMERLKESIHLEEPEIKKILGLSRNQDN